MITPELIKQLREQTGAGMLDAKKALEEAGGDIEKAIDALRKSGAVKLAKKSERTANEGVVVSYVHGTRIGVLVELNCETDFVARTDDFQNLAKEIAMHVAASAPQYVTKEAVPSDVLEREKAVYMEQIGDKPAEMAEKIVEGKLQKFYEENCLLEQAFVKNPDLKISDIINEAVTKLGENIQVKRFARFVLGSEWDNFGL